VVRGGSWYIFASYCRSANRDYYDPDDYYRGFRVALAPISTVPSKDMTIPLAEGVELDMIWIEPGTFIMGSPTDELGRQYNDENQHKVTLPQDYWMGKYEVTQAQYEAVMGTNPSRNKGADLPVEWVSWNDAMEFCAKLTVAEMAADRLPEGYEYTLPTEAQWEYACRAGTTTALNSGKNLSDSKECPEMDEVGWYDDNSNKTYSVGQKQPNAWGLYDMHGNVYEWCLDEDWYEEGRIVRGGAWSSYACYCRSAYRDHSAPINKNNNIGFRVVLAPVQ
jgi:formylglycine-generating enzyme required for sulfatase activity